MTGWLLAERRTGELLAALDRAEVPNPHGRAGKILSENATRFPASAFADALFETGISRQDASLFQQLATVPVEN